MFKQAHLRASSTSRFARDRGRKGPSAMERPRLADQGTGARVQRPPRPVLGQASPMSHGPVPSRGALGLVKLLRTKGGMGRPLDMRLLHGATAHARLILRNNAAGVPSLKRAGCSCRGTQREARRDVRATRHGENGAEQGRAGRGATQVLRRDGVWGGVAHAASGSAAWRDAGCDARCDAGCNAVHDAGYEVARCGGGCGVTRRTGRRGAARGRARRGL